VNFDDVLKQLRVSVKLEPTGALISALVESSAAAVGTGWKDSKRGTAGSVV